MRNSFSRKPAEQRVENYLSWGLAATITGRVVSVHDGDTLTVLVDRHPTKVRLAEIGAPELKQPFGNRSGQSPAEMCAGGAADVDEQGPHCYGRTIGRVTCEGRVSG